MRPVLSRDQIRAFDREWMARGVPGIVLMENAGRGAAHLIGLKARPRKSGEAPRASSSVVGTCVRCADERSLAGVKFLILAGAGNNGGDGLVVARHLLGRGANVRVVCLGSSESLRGDARSAAEALEACGCRVETLPEESEWGSLLSGIDLIVDGLLGTGADREISGTLARLILKVNEASARVVALDVPSGIDAETGAVLGVAIEAEHTVTFAHLKKGQLTTFGQKCGGSITVSHIGVPSGLSEEPAAWLLEESDLRSRLIARSRVAHKGSSGRVSLVAGSPGTVGAARLASRACLRGGAGLVTIVSDQITVSQLESEVVEIMTRAWKLEGDNFQDADAVVVGPGLGQGEEGYEVSRQAWILNCPLVVDADGLRIISGKGREEFLKIAPNLAVFTPHPGEAAALLGEEIAAVESNRFEAAQRLADLFKVVVVLKGSRTIVAAPENVPVVSAFGSPALATAGSGDVLSGLLGALLVGAKSRHDVFERVQTGVALHALAAERWEERHGDRGLLASEIADLIPDVVNEFVEA